MKHLSLLLILPFVVLMAACGGNETDTEKLKAELKEEVKNEMEAEEKAKEELKEEIRAEVEAEMEQEKKSESSGSKTNDSSGKKAAFTAKEIKNAVFMGTEPFWDITFYDSYAERNDPSDRKATFYYMKDGTYAGHQLADAIEPASSNSVTFTIIDEAGMVPGVVTITRKSCSDGMSDNIYPYTFSLQWENGNAWKGCGRIK